MPEVVAAGHARDKVNTVVCDLDGVVYVERSGIEGAGAALSELQDAGLTLLFVTNNSSKTPEMVADDIATVTGFAADPGRVITSAAATAHYLRGRAESALVVGGLGLTTALAAAGVEVVGDWRRAEAVVAGLDRDLTYARLTAATLALAAGAHFVASNLDATYPGREGLYPGGGAIVAALETASGKVPVVCGKPHGPMRDLVRNAAGGGEVLVVGDRPETDLAIAKAEGWLSALVLTGVTADPAAVERTYAPDVVLTSIAALPGYLTGAR